MSKEKEITPEKKVLKKMLESYVLNEDDLIVLKNAINDLINGNISKKRFRTLIIQNKVKIVKEMLDLFPFYQKQLDKTSVVLDNKVLKDNAKIKDLKTEIKEKDDFLHQSGIRINKIFKKLKSKFST